MKKLKDLSKHNSEASALQFGLNNNNPIKNGIACPNCGNELLDSSPMFTFTSNPSKKSIHCDKCEYFGYRIA
jgi:DNA-directed RNA polymerase subunit RPC12/RpoP